MKAKPPEHLFAVGRVLGFWGRRGLLKVRPLTDFPEKLPGKGKVWLWREDTGARRCAITGGRMHGGQVLLGLEGVTDIGAAEALKGSLVMVEEEGLEKLPEGAWYHHQIIGLAVRDEQGRKLGKVAEILLTGGCDIWVVRQGKREIMVPAAARIVRSVDTAAGEVIVSMPPEEGRGGKT